MSNNITIKRETAEHLLNSLIALSLASIALKYPDMGKLIAENKRLSDELKEALNK